MLGCNVTLKEICMCILGYKLEVCTLIGLVSLKLYVLFIFLAHCRL